MESRCKVKTVVPNIPTWAVYYDMGLDVLNTFPVLWYEAEWDDEDKEYGYFQAVTFSMNMDLSPIGNDVNLLGISLTETVSRSDWEEEIVSYIKGMKIRKVKVDAIKSRSYPKGKPGI